MKKTIFITIGILLLLLVMGIWAYIVIYGMPKNAQDVFAKFGLGNNSAPVFTDPGRNTGTSTTNTHTDTKQKALRQLSLRPVAGAHFSGETVEFVEQGTGYIYSVDLKTGEEKLISGTTIAHATEAEFSSSGNTVLIQSLDGTAGSIVVGSITNGTLDGVSLPSGASQTGFTASGDGIYYLLKSERGSSGYVYNLEKKESSLIFTIPLRDVDVLWGNPLYVYTTPTSEQTGYLYRVASSSLQYVTPGARSLMAISYTDGIIVTERKNSNLQSHVLGTSAYELPILLFNEKCTTIPTKTHALYCAAPESLGESAYPDDWYKGVHSFIDNLWYIDIDNTSTSMLSNFLKESGREIDVSSIGTNESGTYIDFINKNDNTLWMFDTTLK
jgi:hypothetical protein